MANKKLLYPSWHYKSQKTYAVQKLKDWNRFIRALYKFQTGSAWCPKKARDLVDPIKLDDADRTMERFVKRVSKQK